MTLLRPQRKHHPCPGGWTISKQNRSSDLKIRGKEVCGARMSNQNEEDVISQRDGRERK